MRIARGARAGALLGTLVAVALPAVTLAHPLGNYTVNRAVAVIVSSQVAVRYIVDMAEIPAFDAIQGIDTNDDGQTDEDEAASYAAESCATVAIALRTSIDGEHVALEPSSTSPATVTFPPGAGGLETLRLECRFAPLALEGSGVRHALTIADTIDDGHVGWHEVVIAADGGATIEASDVTAESASAFLTIYPQASLSSPPDVRSGEATFTAGSQTGEPDAAEAGPGVRGTANDPLAALVAGELTPLALALAVGLAMALGAIHALSPGHGKTLVAAYVIGAGGDARSAMQIGLFVAISHTVGVFALGVVTLLASEFLLPEVLIEWLSLVSGLIVAVLGLTLIVRAVRRERGRRVATAGGHQHVHGDGHDHDHGADHGHEDERGHDHGHDHAPPVGGLTWRSALALGFAGGSVPSASAVIVLLVAISSDRLVFGSFLIVAFGIGMAVVLGGLGLVVARVGAAAQGVQARGWQWLRSPLVRAVTQHIPVLIGTVVLLTGIAFAAVAAARLA